MSDNPNFTLEMYFRNIQEHKRVLKHIIETHENDLKERYSRFVEIENRIKNYLDTLSIYNTEFIESLIATAKSSEDDDWFSLPENQKYFDDLLGLRKEISIALEIDPSTPKHEMLKRFAGIDEDTYKKLELYIPEPIAHTEFLAYLRSL